MAVSISIHMQDASTGFSQTGVAAPHAAAFVKELIAQLRETARPGEPLLPGRVALNVNYPVVLDAEGLDDAAMQAIAALRKAAGIEVPAIVVSARRDPEIGRASMAMGAPMLENPLRAEELQLVLHKLLS